MFNTIMSLFFISYTPYYIYKSLKREKLSHKLSGLATSMLFIFILVGTKPPINLDHNSALGLLGIGVSLELFYLSYKEKNVFLCLAAAVMMLLGFYIFSLHYF